MNNKKKKAPLLNCQVGITVVNFCCLIITTSWIREGAVRPDNSQ